jgi:RNA polymerase sigma-70 factor, ECF subfamily
MNHTAHGSDSIGPDSTSSSLLQRVKAWDSEAWRRLVRLYAPLLYRWCRQSGLQADDAADVAQEVFLAVATHVADFRRDRPGDSFRGWLLAITRNKIRDHFRHGLGQGEGGTDAQERLAQVAEGPSDSSLEMPRDRDGGYLERRALELVHAGIEERTWQAFWRLTVTGESVAEVAKDLGMNVRAVYEAKYRVLRRIRRELGELLEADDPSSFHEADPSEKSR